jgi:hypothetical protein
MMMMGLEEKAFSAKRMRRRKRFFFKEAISQRLKVTIVNMGVVVSHAAVPKEDKPRLCTPLPTV